MPLSFAKPKEKFVIQKITGTDAVKQHLSELGFVKGARIHVISETAGNLIVSVKDSRVALDRSLTNRIFV